MLQTDEIVKAKEIHDDNVRFLMESMRQSWSSIQEMPYKFFLNTLKWKADLEEKKQKRLEDQSRGSNRRTVSRDRAHRKLANKFGR